MIFILLLLTMRNYLQSVYAIIFETVKNESISDVIKHLTLANNIAVHGRVSSVVIILNDRWWPLASKSLRFSVIITHRSASMEQ